MTTGTLLRVPFGPMEKGVLTARQQFFVFEYLKDLNAKQAAIRAGYSARTAEAAASRLLRNVKVSAEIRKAKHQRAQRLRLDGDQVLHEIAVVAFANMYDYVEVDNQGRVRFNFYLLNKERSAPIKRFKLNKIKGCIGLELLDKLEALKLLGKHLGLFTGKQDVGSQGPLSMANLYAQLEEMPELKKLSNEEVKERAPGGGRPKESASMNRRSTIPLSAPLVLHGAGCFLYLALPPWVVPSGDCTQCSGYGSRHNLKSSGLLSHVYDRGRLFPTLAVLAGIRDATLPQVSCSDRGPWEVAQTSSCVAADPDRGRESEAL